MAQKKGFTTICNDCNSQNVIIKESLRETEKEVGTLIEYVCKQCDNRQEIAYSIQMKF